MIILLHGSGDDSSKFENWIRWVDFIMTSHGETVLTVGGVGSKGTDEDEEDQGQNSIAPQALDFLEALGGVFAVPRNVPKIDRLLGMNSAQRNRYAYPKLLAALNDAGGKQFPKAARVPVGGEEDLICELLEEKKKDGKLAGTGIKYRAAVASICAVAYQRRTANPRPIRIIGHSRGGSTAVAIHNILTYHGLDCNTLTLDPCHGKAKMFEKDYYRRIWAGKLRNQPNNKNVGKDWLPDSFMCRPEIKVGEGGSADLFNYARTMNIKHGHMGKLRGFRDEEKEDGSQAHFGMQIQSWLDASNFADPQANLRSFFQEFITDRNTPVGRDRLIIARHVIEVLTGPMPGAL